MKFSDVTHLSYGTPLLITRNIKTIEGFGYAARYFRAGAEVHFGRMISYDEKNEIAHFTVETKSLDAFLISQNMVKLKERPNDITGLVPLDRNDLYVGMKATVMKHTSDFGVGQEVIIKTLPSGNWSDLVNAENAYSTGGSIRYDYLGKKSNALSKTKMKELITEAVQNQKLKMEEKEQLLSFIQHLS